MVLLQPTWPRIPPCGCTTLCLLAARRTMVGRWVSAWMVERLLPLLLVLDCTTPTGPELTKAASMMATNLITWLRIPPSGCTAPLILVAWRTTRITLQAAKGIPLQLLHLPDRWSGTWAGVRKSVCKIVLELLRVVAQPTAGILHMIHRASVVPRGCGGILQLARLLKMSGGLCGNSSVRPPPTHENCGCGLLWLGSL
jgi:hypothetical protein